MTGYDKADALVTERAIIAQVKLSEGKLKRMKALSNERGVIAAAAMDQRGNLQKSLVHVRAAWTFTKSRRR